MRNNNGLICAGVSL